MGSLASVRFRVNEIPEGTLLYDRRSGLTVLLDDFHGKRCWSKPLNVAVQITNRCNRSCKWCYASSSPSEARGLWTREKILELCRFLDSWGVNGVAFGGGEPFTFPSFALLCREVWENTGLDVGATTNGDLVTDDDLTLLRGHFGQLRVSVWHPNEVGLKVKHLLGKGVRIGINTILFRGGFETVRQIIENGAEIGVNDFLVLSCKAYGRASEGMIPVDADIGQLAAFFRKNRRLSFKVDPALSVALSSRGMRFMQPWVEETSGPRFLMVTHDGYVKRDSFSETKVELRDFRLLPRIYAGLHSLEDNGGATR